MNLPYTLQVGALSTSINDAQTSENTGYDDTLHNHKMNAWMLPVIEE